MQGFVFRHRHRSVHFGSDEFQHDLRSPGRLSGFAVSSQERRHEDGQVLLVSASRGCLDVVLGIVGHGAFHISTLANLRQSRNWQICLEGGGVCRRRVDGNSGPIVLLIFIFVQQRAALAGSFLISVPFRF